MVIFISFKVMLRNEATLSATGFAARPAQRLLTGALVQCGLFESPGLHLERRRCHMGRLSDMRQ